MLFVRLPVDLTGTGRTGLVAGCTGGSETEPVAGTFDVEPPDDFNLAIPAYDAKKNISLIFFCFSLKFYLINLLPSVVVVCFVCCWFS